MLSANFAATLFITHDLDLAVTYANRILLVGEWDSCGRWAARGSIEGLSSLSGSLPRSADLAPESEPELAPEDRRLFAGRGAGCLCVSVIFPVTDARVQGYQR
jgi:hypothetical protein